METTNILPDINFDPNKFKASKVARFFSDPQTTAKKVITLGIIAGIGYGFYKILPGLVAMAENITWLIAYGVISLILLYVVLHPGTRMAVKTWIDSKLWWLARNTVKQNKEAILRQGLVKMKQSLKNGQLQQGKLKGSAESIAALITENNETIEEQLNLLNQAQKGKKRVKSEIDYFMGIIKDCEQSNARMLPLKTNIERLDSVIGKLFDSGMLKVNRLERKIELLLREAKVTQDGIGAIQSTTRMLNAKEQELFDYAYNELRDEININKGAIENFFQAAAGDIQTIDLRKGIMESKGLALMEKIGQIGFDKVLESLTSPTALPAAELEKDVVQTNEGGKVEYNVFK